MRRFPRCAIPGILSVFEIVRERFAPNEGRDDVELFFFLAEIVNGNDMRMPQSRRRLGFAKKAFDALCRISSA